MKLSNSMYAGKTLVTGFGPITFDANGNANTTDEAVKALIQLPGFTTDWTDPADNDPDNSSNTDSGAVEHGENNEQEKTQGDAESTQNGSEGSEDDDAEKGEDEDKKLDEQLTEADLKKLQVPSLKKLCKDKGIDITGITTKQPLIDLLLGK